MSQRKSRRKFSKEFKQEAVALSRQPGMTVHRAADDLDVPDNTLHRWRREIDLPHDSWTRGYQS